MNNNEALSNNDVSEPESTSSNRLWDILVGVTYAGMFLFLTSVVYESSIGDGSGEFNAPTSTNIIFLMIAMLVVFFVSYRFLFSKRTLLYRSFFRTCFSVLSFLLINSIIHIPSVYFTILPFVGIIIGVITFIPPLFILAPFVMTILVIFIAILFAVLLDKGIVKIYNIRKI